jgi:chaperonin cofactor prefoldin
MRTNSRDAASSPRIVGLTLLVGALGVVGCGTSLSHTVDDGKLRDMSRQGQLWVYDAENEIVVALDRVDEAQDDLADVRERIKQARKSIEHAEKKKGRGAVDLSEAWLVYLEAMEAWADANIKVQRFGILVARAAVELAKAQVIQREDLLGGKDFSVKVFQGQYEELRQRYDSRMKRIQRMRRDARHKEERWWRMRQRYVAQTGDYDTGLWTE